MRARTIAEPYRVVSVLVARPDGDGDLGRDAAEPEALEVVGRAGLSGDGLVDGEEAGKLLGRAAAVGEDTLERLDGDLGDALVEDARGSSILLIATASR